MQTSMMKNFASLLKLKITSLLGASVLWLTMSATANTADRAIQIPKDTVQSVMWPQMARDYLLKEKNRSQKIIMNNEVIVRAPSQAEDQMNVPVHVDARTIKNVKKIVLIADLNPLPKVLTFTPEQAEARFSVRIKVEQGTPIRAAVLDQDGTWHVGATLIDAAGGGCSQPAVAHSTDNWVDSLANVRGKIWRTPNAQSSKLRLNIKHPMDTGLADGIPAFYLETLALTAPDGTALGQLELHEPVSENPTLTLFPKVKASQKTLIVKGRDNGGNHLTAKVPVPIQSSALMSKPEAK